MAEYIDDEENGLAYLKKGFNWTKQLPSMAIGALSGIPGLGFLINSMRSDPRDRFLGDPYSMQNYTGRDYGYGDALRHGNLTGQDQFGIHTRSMLGDYQGHYGNFMNDYLDEESEVKENKFNRNKFAFAKDVTGTADDSPNITGAPLVTQESEFKSIPQRDSQPHGTDTSGEFSGKGTGNPFGHKDGGRIGFFKAGLAGGDEISPGTSSKGGLRHGSGGTNDDGGTTKKLSISPIINTKTTDLGFTHPTGVVGFDTSTPIGRLRATLNLKNYVKGEDVDPQIDYTKNIGNFNFEGTTDLDNYNLGATYNQGPFFAGATTNNMGDTNFNVGARWQWADGGLVGIL